MNNPNQHAPFSVLFAASANYCAHLAAAMLSLIEQHPNRHFDLHLLHDGITPTQAAKLQRVAGAGGSSLTFHELDVAPFQGLVTGSHFSRANYFRLVAHRVVSAPRCLYLDADLLVTGDLHELLDLDVGDQYLAAVEDLGIKPGSVLGMSPEAPCFNSGVMLLNLERWRAEEIDLAVLRFVREHPQAIRFVDQCGLNRVVNGRWYKLPSTYNHMVDPSGLSGGGTGSPKIVHFAGGSKPWHLGYRGAYKAEYWASRNRTPYRAALADDFTLPRWLKQRVIAPIGRALGFRRVVP